MRYIFLPSVVCCLVCSACAGPAHISALEKENTRLAVEIVQLDKRIDRLEADLRHMQDYQFSILSGSAQGVPVKKARTGRAGISAGMPVKKVSAGVSGTPACPAAVPERKASAGTPAPGAPLPRGPVALPPSGSAAPRPDGGTVHPAGAASAPVPAARSEESMYREALALVRSGRSGQGREAFIQLRTAYPSGKYAPNDEFWIGQSYYQEGDFPRALDQFNLVARQYPAHHKAADALFRAGVCYAHLGNSDAATAKFREVLARFPQSEPAGIIRRRNLVQ